MAHIIITLFIEDSGKEFDLEVPTDVLIENLIDDVIQTIMGADPDLYFNPVNTALYYMDSGKRLDKDKTLEELGVFNAEKLRIDSQ